MIVTASKLRANIYNVLDKVLETGVAVEINRKGRTLKIIPVGRPSKLSNLKNHNTFKFTWMTSTSLGLRLLTSTQKPWFWLVTAMRFPSKSLTG